MIDSDLFQALDQLRSTMISVSTGGQRIQDVDEQFKNGYDQVADVLTQRGFKNPLPYRSLWDWHGRWSRGDLPTYKSRRLFVSELFDPLVKRIRDGVKVEYAETGWQRVDRTVGEFRDRLASAETEEHFQAVGLLCREALISVAQSVFDAAKHPTHDGVKASQTDAKRMLDAYIGMELPGGSNDEARKHAKSALDLALHLQHKRTATFRDAAMCVEATTSVINIVAIISGLRDPV
jgi:hypothetical protein